MGGPPFKEMLAWQANFAHHHYADVAAMQPPGSPIMFRCFPVLLCILTLTTPVRAELVALEILKREPFAGGKEFGSTGDYEKITAVARFAISPGDELNRM